MKEQKTYTVHDVRRAECNLEPLKCIHCGYVGLFYSQRVRDAYCPDCGRWQLDEQEEVL